MIPAEKALITAALEAGAHKAVILRAADIVLSEQFRDICKGNQCGKYGRCWMCPPDIPPVQEVMERVRSYSYALWYQTIAPLEDSFDIEGMMRAKDNHVKLSQKLQKSTMPMLPEDSLYLSCGGCHLCPICAKEDGLPCRMPDKAMPSLEGYCVDVYNTTRNTELKYTNGKNTVTYFGAILF